VILFAVLTCIIKDDERNVTRYNEYKDKYGTYGVFELPEGAVLRHQSEDWARRLLSGFRQMEYAPLVFTTMNGHKSNGFYYFGEK
jgi:hypothetical protein